MAPLPWRRHHWSASVHSTYLGTYLLLGSRVILLVADPLDDLLRRWCTFPSKALQAWL